MRLSVICMAVTVAKEALSYEFKESLILRGTEAIARRAGPAMARAASARPGGEDDLPSDVDGVDQPDHHGVDGEFLGLRREPGARPLADEHHLVDPRAQRVHDDESPPGGDQPLGALVVDLVRLD